MFGSSRVFFVHRYRNTSNNQKTLNNLHFCPNKKKILLLYSQKNKNRKY